MIHGILLVLKIIGILFLCLLLLVLSVVALVLFVPIRYRMKAKKDQELVAEAKVTWLLSLLSIQFQYKGESMIQIRIFGMVCYDSRTAEEKQRKKEQKRERKEQRTEKRKNEKIQRIEQRTNKKEQKSESAEPIKDIKSESKQLQDSKPDNMPEETTAPGAEEAETSEAEKKQSKRMLFLKKLITVFRKIIESIKNGTYTIQKIYDKIVQIGKTISDYVDIWQRSETQAAFSLCKHSLSRIWKQMKPRKMKLFLHIGTEDPAVMGQILVYYSMCYPYLGKIVSIEPDFEQFLLEGNLFIKGKITVFVLLCIAWKLFFDKNIRKVLTLFNKEER